MKTHITNKYTNFFKKVNEYSGSKPALLGFIHKTGGFNNENGFILYKIAIEQKTDFFIKTVETVVILWYTEEEKRTIFYLFAFLNFALSKNNYFKKKTMP